ncbi:hypothetical protein CPC08DRAFT_704189 [Agrocybe pediades]|nr:hypothetical protein CPC08DRAFT_704189 [Agrocybe pediades]
MFSKALIVACLSLALSVEASPNRFGNGKNFNPQCGSVSTVIRTVTVSARGGAATQTAAVPVASAPFKGNNGNNNAGKNNGGNNNNAGKNNGGNSNNNVGNNNAGNNNGGNNNGGNNANGDPQKSLTLDPRVIASGFANNGQDVPTAGQVASLTSTNNFINFCLNFPNLQITNGKQIQEGSCNPAPIGVIPSIDNMPSSKFVFPSNFATLKAGVTFDIVMNIKNMQTGFFTNAQATYFAAPQQLNQAGQIQGHSHVVIESLTSLSQTTPTDPKKFAFFKGLNAAANNGQLTATVPNGLTPGFYKLSSINAAANHQPVIVPVAQHGSLDDAVYFTVTADGKPASGNNIQGTAPAATSAAAGSKATAKSSSKKGFGSGRKRALNRL